MCIKMYMLNKGHLCITHTWYISLTTSTIVQPSILYKTIIILHTLLLLLTLVTVSCNKYSSIAFTSCLLLFPFFLFFCVSGVLFAPRSTRSSGVYEANSRPYNWQEASRNQAWGWSSRGRTLAGNLKNQKYTTNAVQHSTKE